MRNCSWWWSLVTSSSATLFLYKQKTSNQQSCTQSSDTPANTAPVFPLETPAEAQFALSQRCPPPPSTSETVRAAVRLPQQSAKTHHELVAGDGQPHIVVPLVVDACLPLPQCMEGFVHCWLAAAQACAVTMIGERQTLSCHCAVFVLCSNLFAAVLYSDLNEIVAAGVPPPRYMRSFITRRSSEIFYLTSRFFCRHEEN